MFVQIFINFLKFSKVFDEYIFAECLPEQKFWRRHCNTGLERNSCMKFCPMSPTNQNSGAPGFWLGCIRLLEPNTVR